MASLVQPQERWIDYLKTIDSPTLSNAIEVLRVRPRNVGFAPHQIHCLFQELGRMVGFAVTAQVETMTEATVDRRGLLTLYEVVEQSPKPVVVAFQEIGAQSQFAAHCGEVMATIFLRLGAVGLVSDSAVRDIPEVRAMRFQYFACGAVASHAYFRIVRVGVPIQVQGLVIHPGDIVHGDENGLIVVPKEGLDKLPEAVDAVQTRERTVMSFVRGADFTFAGLRKYVLE